MLNVDSAFSQAEFPKAQGRIRALHGHPGLSLGLERTDGSRLPSFLESEPVVAPGKRRAKSDQLLLYREHTDFLSPPVKGPCNYPRGPTRFFLGSMEYDHGPCRPRTSLTVPSLHSVLGSSVWLAELNIYME